MWLCMYIGLQYSYLIMMFKMVEPEEHPATTSPLHISSLVFLLAGTTTTVSDQGDRGSVKLIYYWCGRSTEDARVTHLGVIT
jgi:hypothetical protein